MPIYEYTGTELRAVERTTLVKHGVRERADLQRLLRENIEIVSPGTLVIAEEFGNWDESRRRIDLLGVDKSANLVVIELKRTEDGRHMELQAIRYAAMVSTMSFDKAVTAYERYLVTLGEDRDARDEILGFLEWDEPDDDGFGRDVRIVLVSEDFSKELTTAVMWLNERDLDIRCVRLRPYHLEGRLLVDTQQIIPLPEAAQFQIEIREREERKRVARQGKWDEQSLLLAVTANGGEDARGVTSQLYNWIISKADSLRWSSGEKFGGLTAIVTKDGINYPICRLLVTAKVVIPLFRLQGKGPFRDETVVEELRSRINQIPGVQLAPESRRLFCDVGVFADGRALSAFQQVCEWVIERVKTGELA